MKFLPKYTLSVETLLPDSGGTPANVTIELLSCEFEVRRATLASSQTATFRIYNLGKKTQKLLQKDWFNLGDVRAIQFRAGYEGEPSTLIFNGTVKQAQSYHRSGAQDTVTEIEAFDGGAAMANGYSLRTIAAGTMFSDIIKSLAQDLPNIAKSGFIGSLPGAIKRGATFAGNTWAYIFQMTGGLAMIDNGQLKILGQTEVAGTEVPSITSAAGLLGSPQRYLNMMKVTMMFEPKFTLGQLVSLDSEIIPQFNGAYKVMSVLHRGVISQTRDGERRTEVTLWNGLGNADTWTKVPEAPIS